MRQDPRLSSESWLGSPAIHATLLAICCATSAFATTVGATASPDVPLPPPIPASERAALLSFYNATNGDGWTDNAGWLGAPGTECGWFGVVCDPGKTHVTGLQLTSNHLAGQLPGLAPLTALEDLELGDNLLTGTIPDLSALHQLRMFYVNNNALTGAFPAFWSAAPLEQIDLSANALSGALAPLNGLPALMFVNFTGNLFSGPLPALSGLSNLVIFGAGFNQLTGTIPPLSGLDALSDFEVQANGLVGDLPSIAALPSLDILEVANNRLTGALPTAYPANLQFFDAEDNALSGAMSPLGSPPLLAYRIGGNPQLSGAVAAGPVPNTLASMQSRLCPTGLQASNDGQVNAQWNAATGHTPWQSNCDQEPPSMAPPGGWVTFDPANVALDAGAVMTITLANWNTQSLTGVALADSYPAGIRNAGDPSPANTCGGTVTAAANDAGMSLSSATLPPHSTCTIEVHVVGAATGVWPNAAESITSNETGARDSGPGVLIVVAADSAPIAQEDQIQVQAFGSTDAIVGDPRVPSSVLDNDTDPDAGDYVASATLVTGANPACGTLTLEADGTFSYQSISDQCQTDSFTYEACDTYTQCATATAHVAITSAPTIAAPDVQNAFTPANVLVGDAAQMSITLTNHDPNRAITGVAFTDDYPPHMANMPVGNLIANDCGGLATASPNGTSVVLGGGTIPANQSCSITIQVIGTSAGTAENHTGPVSSSNAETSAGGTGVLTVSDGSPLAAVLVTKVFAPQSIAVGEASVMTITLLNNDISRAVTGVTFTDNYPAPLHMANAGEPVILASTCFGTVTAPPGGTSVALEDGMIAANGWCYIKIQVVGTSSGITENHTGPVTSTNAQPGIDASATLNVDSAGGTTPQTISFLSTPPGAAKVGDPAYVAVATASSGLPVVLTIDGSSATVCAIDDGSVRFIGAGTCSIDANQGGDANYAPAPQAHQSFDVSASSGIMPQTIQFTSTPPVDAAVGDPAYVATATASSDLPVVLTVDAMSDTVCAITGGLVTFIGAGACTIDANQGGDAMYAPASQVQQSFDVSSAHGDNPQTIAFTSTPPADAAVGGTTYLATAEATSGLPIVLAIDGSSATVCTINDGTVSFVGAGTCTIDANQGGNATYAAAPQAQQSFAVASAGGTTPQAIAFTSTPPDPAVVAGPTYLAVAVADSHLPVVLTIDAASATACTIDHGNVSFVGAGTCTIDANQGGDATYAAATQVQQPFAVASAGGMAPQTIAFASTAPENASVGGPTYLALATASSHLPVALTIDASAASVCTIDRGTVSFIGAGTCKVDANQGGDETYAPASETPQSFAVSGNGAPTVTCLLRRQVDVVGDTVSVDLSLLFAPPPGQTLAYGAANAPPSLSVVGALLTGTLHESDVPPAPYTYAATLSAAVPGGGSAEQEVVFQVLPTGEILLRNGFEDPTPSVPCIE